MKPQLSIGLAALAFSMMILLSTAVYSAPKKARLTRPSADAGTAVETKVEVPVSGSSDLDPGTFELKPLSPVIEENTSSEKSIVPAATELHPKAATPLLPGAGTKEKDNTEINISNEIPKGVLSADALRAANLELLAKYDLMVLIDESGSMATIDCNGKSRWMWCEDEARRFGEISGSAMPNGFDLTLFNFHYRPMGACRTENLHQIFVQHRPYGGTVLAGPIDYAMNRFANLRGYGNVKPLLVAIITDGEPQDDEQVEETIVRVTKIVPKGEVKIVFLKVGESLSGDEFMRHLDDGLISRGAAYDAVDARSFDYLRSHGLLQTLCDAIRE